MKMEAQSHHSFLKQALNVSVQISDYELQRETKDGSGNLLGIILDRVVEKVTDAFIEQHQDEILASLNMEDIQEKLNAMVINELNRAAIKHILK